jgi:hypothetical protein
MAKFQQIPKFVGPESYVYFSVNLFVNYFRFFFIFDDKILRRAFTNILERFKDYLLGCRGVYELMDICK